MLVLQLRIDSLTIRSNCNAVLLCYFSLNGVSCSVIAWTFSIARQSH